jgi:hypothetical protein
MPGLVPGIPTMSAKHSSLSRDGRIKSGHDDGMVYYDSIMFGA